MFPIRDWGQSTASRKCNRIARRRVYTVYGEEILKLLKMGAGGRAKLDRLRVKL
jgi:hypothetical protein